MEAAKVLAGVRALVVEDDFYLADDERVALEAAGAGVIGPCDSIAEALILLETHAPDVAILDISLADGPSFDLARLVGARGILILFVTGYDAGLVPPDLAEKARLQKPITKVRLVKAVEELVQAGKA
ncbi:hypothetical protein COC42_12220 [Sphingomonas spermidinifaciens]|uniref:Response regulatory domain-containing protein n=1 Tax=Sphingomonas spermidinifaciens TaxID=1141889 RepID=A0A2A4B3J5_9SPHN|nr:response regulator [Sphingomonas spermidinifaciens]PCD02216.1 hypothetical protein COC42_12220 [Sphingomonas spermidinifaciens]